MANLIEKYLALKNSYRDYDTRYAIKRMQAFRRATHELTDKGYPIAIELLGSISFGLVEPYSDADCVIIHSCDLHWQDGDCPPNCPNLVFEQNEIIKSLKRRLGKEMFNIEFLDWLNLRTIESAINTNDILENEYLYRLLYYRTVGRPVNRPLFIRYCNILEKNPEFLSGFSKWSSHALASYLETPTHRQSFNKYNERIIHRGLDLPDKLQEELRKYLE